VRLTGESGFVEILFDPSELEYCTDKVVFTNHQGENVDVYTIDFNIKMPREKITVLFHITSSEK
jgi:hypothetical protein